MTNQHAPAQFFRGDDDHSDDNSLNIDTAVAIQTIKPALPQAAPIAPSTGFTSRYDSDIDYDDNSVTLSEVDAVENYDDSFLNSSMLGSGLMESWATMEGDNDIHTQAALDASNRVSNSSDVCSAVSVMQGPRFVPPISTEDEETKAATKEEPASGAWKSQSEMERAFGAAEPDEVDTNGPVRVENDRDVAYDRAREKVEARIDEREEKILRDFDGARYLR